MEDGLNKNDEWVEKYSNFDKQTSFTQQVVRAIQSVTGLEPAGLHEPKFSEMSGVTSKKVLIPPLSLPMESLLIVLKKI